MKSRTVLLSVFALLACASCAKENFGDRKPVGQGGETVLSAVIAKAEISKTRVDASVSGSALPVYWSDGDAINVNGQASSPLSVPEGAKLSEADFNLRSVSAPYNVIYPASIVKSDVYSKEGSIEVEIPAVQAYSPDSFASGSAILYGYSDVEGGTVTMTNLCSVIRVSLKSMEQDVIDAVSLTSNGKEAFVAGTFNFTPLTGKLEVLDGQNNLSLSIDSPVVLDQEGRDFWFAVPSGNYADGLSISFRRESDGRKMLCIWTPVSNLAAGVIYHFSDVVFVPGAKDIDSPDDWEEFALACNEGKDISKWLGKDGKIRIGADITADNLTTIDDFADTLVIDGQGHSITRNAAEGPLFKIVEGKISNIATRGSFVSENTPNRVAPIADELTGLGSIEGCVNYMEMDVPLVEDHVMLAGIVRLITGGTVADCHNHADITGRPDVSASDYNCQIAGIAAQVYPAAEASVTIKNCTNSGTLIQRPKSPTKHVYGVAVSGLGGIAGWIRYRAGAGLVALDNCDNSGMIYFDGSDITDETGMKACAISVGGIAGLAANINTTKGELVVPNGSNGVNVSFKDCDNTGMVYNCGMNYSTSSSSSNKSFSGGLVGTLVGNAGDNMALLANCSNKGDVIPYDITTDNVEVPSARPAYDSVIGGLVGFGGYTKMEDCTVKCHLGNGKRLVAAVGGAIGFNVRPFIIKRCSVYFDGYFQRINGYKMNRSVFVTVPVKYTGGSSMGLQPDVKGSEISGCRGGATLLTNMNTVSNNDYASDRSDLTKNGTYTSTIFNTSASALDNLVCGEGYVLNTEDVTLSDNKYWDGI